MSIGTAIVICCEFAALGAWIWAYVKYDARLAAWEARTWRRTVKVIIAAMLAIAVMISATACDTGNYNLIDTNDYYTSAIIRLPDGKILYVDIEKWMISETNITIICDDGTVYNVHKSNCALIAEAT